MKKITYTLTILFSTLFIPAQAKSVDSLLKQLDTTTNACLQAELYTNIAAELIQFNGPKTREISYEDAGKAVDYVLKAIHFNAKNDDTLALRNNFDCLGSAYFIQRKYTQAKWFILQSNCISRDRKDVPAIINSLMRLASVKIAIKDYAMAEKDFNEAIVLARYEKAFNREVAIEQCLASLYSNAGDKKNAALVEKRYNTLAANIERYAQQQEAAKKLKQQQYYALLKTKKVKKAVVLTEAAPVLNVSEDVKADNRVVVSGGTDENR